MNNIILIGMPGAGKSTLGVVLAKVLGCQFLDSDLLIQKQEKRKLHEIIAREGYEGFQKIENQVNASIETENTVIATGGSVVYCEEAMEHLKEISVVVYLKLDFEEMERRIGDPVARGVVLKNGMTLRKLYDERTPYYERYADIVFDEAELSAEESAGRLAELVREHFR